jgi:hypothetical protein
MKTLGVIALVLGLAFLVAGMVSFALNRREPGSDEKSQGKAGETGPDPVTMDNEPAEAAIHHSGATGATDSGPAAATHTAGN